LKILEIGGSLGAMVDEPVDEDPEYENETDDDENVGLEDVPVVAPEDVPPDQGDAGDIGLLTPDDG
jgi:hypothetical protein